MKITLIIPDIHLKWERADKIISNVGADEIIFLGDYFDDFNDTPDMIRKMCEWLSASVEKPNRIHLMGNHDIHYAYPNRMFECSGYEQWKYFITQDNVDRKVWDKLKWYHILDDRWFLSHGGLHKLYMNQKILSLRETRDVFNTKLDQWLHEECIKGLRNESWVFGIGHSRGGCQRVGGLLWCDYEREFAPVKGLNQIVGHTPQGFGFPTWCLLNNNGQLSHPPYSQFNPTIEMLDDPNLSVNIDLDVHGNMHYGIWDGKKLKVGKYSDL